MKALVVVFVLGVVLFCGNASFLEHVLNHTHVKGDMLYNTTGGLRLGYNGSLFFDNGYLGFEIANLGGSFKAIPKGVSKYGNTTNGSVDYSGSIQVAQGKHRANVTVDGTAGLRSEYQVNANKTGVAYNTTLGNRNQWKVTGDQFEAQGTHGAVLNISGGGCKDGNTIYARQKLRGGVRTAGNVTVGGNTTNFTVAKWGEGGVKKKIWVGDQTNATLFGRRVPSAAVDGKAGFKRGSWVAWNNTEALTKSKGGALFSGLIWSDLAKNNDTVTQKVHWVKNADYGFKGKTKVNNKDHVLFGGVGTVTRVGGAELNVTTDKKHLTAAVGDLGDLHHVGVVKVNPKEGDKEIFEKQLEALKENKAEELDAMEFEDLSQLASDSDKNKGRPVKAYIHAQWAAGKGVQADRNDNNTVDVATRGGAKWRAIGIDSKTKKPWHVKGGKAYNSTFEIDPNNSAIKNIAIHLGNDTQIVDIIQKKIEGVKNVNKLW